VGDITSNLLLGVPVTGTTVGRPNLFAWEPGMSGALSGDALFVFHLESSRTVTLSLCPTLSSHPEWDSILYLRGACNDPGTNIQYNDDGCSHLSRIVRTLGPGTYYLIVDGYGNYEACEGPYILGFGQEEGPPVCVVTPDNAAWPEQEPNNSPALATDLGEFVESDSVRTGTIDADGDPEDYYRFHVPCGEFVEYQVTADCYGDGSSSNLYLSVLDESLDFVTGDGGLGPLLSAPFVASPGATYTVAVYAGTAPYRLRIAPVARYACVSSGILPGAEVADESEPNDDAWDADDLGNLTAGGHLAAQGRLDPALGDGGDFYSFVPQGAGIGVSVILDAYDDGLGSNDFDVTLRDSGGTPVLLLSGSDPVESGFFTPVPGALYYAEVTGNVGTGCYRLLLTGH